MLARPTPLCQAKLNQAKVKTTSSCQAIGSFDRDFLTRVILNGNNEGVCVEADTMSCS